MKQLLLLIGVLLYLPTSTYATDRTFTVGDVSFTMLPVAGNTFYMGAQKTSNQQPNYDANASSNEQPVHLVTVNDFYIGQYVITQGLWEALMYETPNAASNNQWTEGYGLGASYPAYYITYTDVQRFIDALNGFCRLTNQLKADEYFRLPTEAEWEFAARGGSLSKGYLYAGSNYINDVAWYVENSPESTQAVGKKQPNELGLYDMSGNVMEWCSDYYTDYTEQAQNNPTGATSGTYRVLRGGVYLRPATLCRIAARSYAFEDTSVSYYGARLALQAHLPTHTPAATVDKINIACHNQQLTITGIPINTPIRVINLMGTTLYQAISTDNTHTINLINYPTGVYIVKVGTHVKRIKKQ